MDVKAMINNIAPYGVKPCMLWGAIVDVYVREQDGALRCKVEVDGMPEQVDAGFYFTCQHWIYNRKIPVSTGEEAGYSSFCMGDQVMVYIGPMDSVAVGVYDDTFAGIVTHQPCWPLFDPATAFAVVPLAAAQTTHSWGAPFLGASGLPFDFVGPFTDVFGETRPRGTYQVVSSAQKRHVKLITAHEVNGQMQYAAHALHEAFRVLPAGVFMCPATTRNDKYFLGKKIGYNNTSARVMLDDISIVRGVIDGGTLRGLAFFKDDEKVYLGTFSKILDRITTIWDASDLEPFVEVKVGYFEFGRVDHLWCMKKLIEASGEQSIVDLPEFTQAQTPSVVMMRNVWCVQNAGLSFSTGTPSGLRLIFYGFGTANDLGVNATKNYDALVTYSQDAIDHGEVQLTTRSPYYWEPSATGGAKSLSRTGGTPGSSFPQDYNWDISITSQVFNGPDYLSVIGGDNTFTIGLYGTSSGGDFSENYTWTYYGAPLYRWDTTSCVIEIDFHSDTALVFKHNGVEITRAENTVDCETSQNVTLLHNNVTGDTSTNSSTITHKEVHWFMVRPDLGLYIFTEVQVFDDHIPYAYRPGDVSVDYCVWFDGTKTVLSSSTTEFPSNPTASEYTRYEHMLGDYSGPVIPLENTIRVRAGVVTNPDASTFALDLQAPYLPVAYLGEPYASTFSFQVPRTYTLDGRIWVANSDYQSLSGVPIYEAQRNAGGALMGRNFSFSPVRNDANTEWIAPLNIYNSNQVMYQYTDHWSWLAESNEVNQMVFGISEDSYSSPRVFTYQRMYYSNSVTLGNPQFFGEHIYISIPDVFTTGLVHEFFSGPADMLQKIKAAINPQDPDGIVFATTVS